MNCLNQHHSCKRRKNQHRPIFPPKKLAPKISSFSRAFPKNQQFFACFSQKLAPARKNSTNWLARLAHFCNSAIAVTQSTNIAKLHWCKFDSTQVHQRAKIIKFEGKRISLGAKTDITEKHSCKNTNTKITICNHKHTIWLQERGIAAKYFPLC